MGRARIWLALGLLAVLGLFVGLPVYQYFRSVGEPPVDEPVPALCRLDSGVLARAGVPSWQGARTSSWQLPASAELRCRWVAGQGEHVRERRLEVKVVDFVGPFGRSAPLDRAREHFRQGAEFYARPSGEHEIVESLGDEALFYRDFGASAFQVAGILVRAGARVYDVSYTGSDKALTDLRRMPEGEAEAAVREIGAALAERG